MRCYLLYEGHSVQKKCTSCFDEIVDAEKKKTINLYVLLPSTFLLLIISTVEDWCTCDFFLLWDKRWHSYHSGHTANPKSTRAVFSGRRDE